MSLMRRYFVCADVVLVVQYIYYTTLQRRRQRLRAMRKSLRQRHSRHMHHTHVSPLWPCLSSCNHMVLTCADYQVVMPLFICTRRCLNASYNIDEGDHHDSVHMGAGWSNHNSGGGAARGRWQLCSGRAAGAAVGRAAAEGAAAGVLLLHDDAAVAGLGLGRRPGAAPHLAATR